MKDLLLELLEAIAIIIFMFMIASLIISFFPTLYVERIK